VERYPGRGRTPDLAQRPCARSGPSDAHEFRPRFRFARSPCGFAGLAIGLTSLVAIHLVGINITGTSVNPARSIGPALASAASNPHAVLQLCLFVIAPLIGAGAAGILFREGALLTPPSSSTSR
jgi:hypothetical protein